MANHNTRTMETVRMLVVSRETAVLQCFWLTADSSSWANGWGAMERMQSGRIADSLFLDIPRGNADGLRVLRWLRRLRPDLRVSVTATPTTAANRERLCGWVHEITCLLLCSVDVR